MLPTRLGLQSKIIIFTAIVVISVVVVSTSIAVVLTWRMVEEEIYLKALAQAKATAHQLVNQHALQDSEALAGAVASHLHRLFNRGEAEGD